MSKVFERLAKALTLACLGSVAVCGGVPLKLENGTTVGVLPGALDYPMASCVECTYPDNLPDFSDLGLYPGKVGFSNGGHPVIKIPLYKSLSDIGWSIFNIPILTFHSAINTFIWINIKLTNMDNAVDEWLKGRDKDSCTYTILSFMLCPVRVLFFKAGIWTTEFFVHDDLTMKPVTGPGEDIEKIYDEKLIVFHKKVPSFLYWTAIVTDKSTVKAIFEGNDAKFLEHEGLNAGGPLTPSQKKSRRDFRGFAMRKLILDLCLVNHKDFVVPKDKFIFERWIGSENRALQDWNKLLMTEMFPPRMDPQSVEDFNKLRETQLNQLLRSIRIFVTGRRDQPRHTTQDAVAFYQWCREFSKEEREKHNHTYLNTIGEMVIHSAIQFCISDPVQEEAAVLAHHVMGIIKDIPVATDGRDQNQVDLEIMPHCEFIEYDGNKRPIRFKPGGTMKFAECLLPVQSAISAWKAAGRTGNVIGAFAQGFMKPLKAAQPEVDPEIAGGDAGSVEPKPLIDLEKVQGGGEWLANLALALGEGAQEALAEISSKEDAPSRITVRKNLKRAIIRSAAIRNGLHKALSRGNEMTPQRLEAIVDGVASTVINVTGAISSGVEKAIQEVGKGGDGAEFYAGVEVLTETLGTKGASVVTGIGNALNKEKSMTPQKLEEIAEKAASGLFNVSGAISDPVKGLHKLIISLMQRSNRKPLRLLDAFCRGIENSKNSSTVHLQGEFWGEWQIIDDQENGAQQNGAKTFFENHPILMLLCKEENGEIVFTDEGLSATLSAITLLATLSNFNVCGMPLGWVSGSVGGSVLAYQLPFSFENSCGAAALLGSGLMLAANGPAATGNFGYLPAAVLVGRLAVNAGSLALTKVNENKEALWCAVENTVLTQQFLFATLSLISILLTLNEYEELSTALGAVLASKLPFEFASLLSGAILVFNAIMQTRYSRYIPAVPLVARLIGFKNFDKGLLLVSDGVCSGASFVSEGICSGVSSICSFVSNHKDDNLLDMLPGIYKVASYVASSAYCTTKSVASSAYGAVKSASGSAAKGAASSIVQILPVNAGLRAIEKFKQDPVNPCIYCMFSLMYCCCLYAQHLNCMGVDAIPFAIGLHYSASPVTPTTVAGFAGSVFVRRYTQSTSKEFMAANILALVMTIVRTCAQYSLLDDIDFPSEIGLK